MLAACLRAHARELFPRRPRRQQRLVLAFDAWLCRHIRGHLGCKGLVDGTGWSSSARAAPSRSPRSPSVGVWRGRRLRFRRELAGPSQRTRLAADTNNQLRLPDLIIAAFPEYVVGQPNPPCSRKTGGTRSRALRPARWEPLATTSWNGCCSEGVLPIYPARSSALAWWSRAVSTSGCRATHRRARIVRPPSRALNAALPHRATQLRRPRARLRRSGRGRRALGGRGQAGAADARKN